VACDGKLSYAKELSISNSLFDGRRDLTLGDVRRLADEIPRLQTDGCLEES
jgi:hypothetical protein